MTNAAEGRDWAWRSSDSTQAVGTCKQCFVEHRCAAGASSETGISEAWAIMVKYMAEMAPSHVAAGGVLTDPSAGGDTELFLLAAGSRVASAGAVAVKGCRRRSRDGFSLNAALPAPMSPCLGHSEHSSLGKAAARHGQGSTPRAGPRLHGHRGGRSRPGGPLPGCRGARMGGSGRALTMLAAAVAHLLCPNRRGSARPARPRCCLIPGVAPPLRGGRPRLFYLHCINLHRSAYIFCVRLFR